MIFSGMTDELEKIALTIAQKADKHFSSDEKTKWDGFITNLKSPKFRKTISEHPMADAKLKKFVENNGKHVSSKDDGIKIPGSKPGILHTVKKHPDDSYTCSCPSYMFKGSITNGSCKHIDQVKERSSNMKEKPSFMAQSIIKTGSGILYIYSPNHVAPAMMKIAKALVPKWQQESQSTCSAACLKAVLNHYGHKINEVEAALEIGVKKNKGAETTDIVNAAKGLGFNSYEKSLTMDEAKKLTDQGIPIICDIQSFNKPGSGHYVVLTDIEDNKAYIMDPNTPGNERTINLKDFEERWWDRSMAPPHSMMKSWGVVITPNKS